MIYRTTIFYGIRQNKKTEPSQKIKRKFCNSIKIHNNINTIFYLNNFSKILYVIRYVGRTPSIPNAPDARVLPVSKGLSEA